MTEWNMLSAFTALCYNTILLAVASLNRLLAPHLKIYRSTDRSDRWQGSASISAASYKDIGDGFVNMTQLSFGTVLLPTWIKIWYSDPST